MSRQNFALILQKAEFISWNHSETRATDRKKLISFHARRNYDHAVPTHLQEEASRYAEQIESEMRSIGFWQTAPLRPEQLRFKQAFAMDTMTFAQWLQFIFLPRVREAIASNEFPSSSSVGAQAVREFDGTPDADRLVTLLSEFDALFD